MKRKYLYSLLICMLLVFSFGGCAKKDEPKENDSTVTNEDVEADEEIDPETDFETDVEVDVETETEPDVETEVESDGEMNLEEVFQQGMDSYKEKGMEVPVLSPEFDIAYLENFYPGIGYAKIKQLYIAMAPEENIPMEIALVEVEDGSDVAAIRDILQERIDAKANDEEHPEEAAVWKQNGIVTIRDHYIFMAVMPDEYGIPEVFVLD